MEDDLPYWHQFDKDRIEAEEMERFRAERDQKEFDLLKPVTNEILEKMDTKRLLAYYNRFRKDVRRGDYQRADRDNSLLDRHLRTVKHLLDVGPHIDRPGKPKKEKKKKGLTKKK